ncbi:HYR domain-containing protein [Cognataquiflexum aquatile]|uniref:HYR domain-containing protein n=1 Tax=Cognataquiflexum aquatile TaxID=2249427 RepID=UPI00130074BF|nr:HYR domain-containing protein [Cognataquiflexum aquatile]
MKKLYGLLALLFLLFPPLLQAQNPGELDTSFNPGSGITSGSVYSTYIQSDGKILIGGSFTFYNGFDGTFISNISRLDTDGRADQSFNPGTGTNGPIRTIVVQSDGKILIGGAFSTFNGVSRNNIARLHPNGSLDTSFNPGIGPNYELRKIVVQPDGKILIGGFFSFYNGTPRNYIARINSDGSLDTSYDPGSGTDGPVLAISVQDDGKVVLGGNFTTYNGYSRSRIARANQDGSIDQSFNNLGTGFNNTVWVVVIQTNGKILVGGDFTWYDPGYPITIDDARVNIARLNSDGSLDTDFHFGNQIEPKSSVFSISIQDDEKVIIGGSFFSKEFSRIIRLNSDGSLDSSFLNGGTDGIVWTTALQTDSNIIIAGEFNYCNSVVRRKIARLFGVSDTIPPIPDLEPLADINTQFQINFEDLTIPTATDNVDGVIYGTTNEKFFPILNQGTTTITWTYTDRAGNTSSQTQNIIIHDTEIPVIGTVEDINKILDVGVCEANLNFQGGDLILWNKLGSQEEVTNSAYGPDLLPGSGMLFEEGEYGNGLYVPMVQGVRSVHSPYTPRNIVPLGSFSIEFWYKRTHDDEHDGHSFVSGGYEDNEKGTVDFTALSGYVGWWWLYGIVRGNDGQLVGRYKYDLITQENWEAFFPKNEWIHLAFSHDATWPVGNRIKIFRNGVELEGVDGEFDTGYMGHVGQYGDAGFRIGNFVAWDTWGAGGVMDNIKLWNYPKTDFSDRFEEFSSTGDYIKTPAVTDNGSQISAIGIRSDGLPLDSPYPVGVTTITWTAADEAGNEAVPVVQTITIRDQGIPVIGEAGPITQASDVGLCTAILTIIPPTVSDDCGTIVALGTRSDGLELTAPYPIGTTTITWTATDVSGNIAEPVLQTITVNDEEKPVIGGIESVIQAADPGLCEAQISINLPTVSDNCIAEIPTGVRDDGLELTAPYPVGTTTITWTAMDISGNNAEPVLQTITVNDEEKPVIGEQATINQSNDIGMCIALVTIIPPSAADNCSVIEPQGTRNDGLSLTSEYPVGITTITWTASDEAGNIAVEVMQDVVITDTEAPVVLTKNLEFTIEVGQSVTITPQDVDNGSTDNCGINSLSLSKTIFTDLDEGINDVVLTATDAAANTNSATAIVTIVVDRSCKVRAIAQDVTLILDKNGLATLTTSAVNNGSYSECIGSSLTMTLSQSVYSCSDLGQKEAVLTVRDKDGNQGTDSFIVTVIDNLPPSFGSVPKTLKVSINPNSSYVLPDFTSQYPATDNCIGVLYTQVPGQGTALSTVGTHPVVLTASDLSGNTVSSTINIDISISKPKGGTKPKSAVSGSRTLGLEEATENSIFVYPNPAISEANLEVRILNPDDVIIKMKDANGREVFTTSRFKESSFTQPLDLKGLSKGLYIIQVQIGFELISKRLVIR